MVRVVVVVVAVVAVVVLLLLLLLLLLLMVMVGKYICTPVDDLVAQNSTNNLGRSQNSNNPDPKKFLPVTNPFRENHP